MILLNVNFAELGSNAFEIIILLLVIAGIAYFIGRYGRVAQKEYDLSLKEKENIQKKMLELSEKYKDISERHLSVQQDVENENLRNARLKRELQGISKKLGILEEELSQCKKEKKQIVPTATQAEVLEKIKMRSSTVDFERIGKASFDDKDHLQEIKGIGQFIEEKLNALGIYKYNQIAKFTSDDEETVNKVIEFFPGRVKRDDWKGQAKKLM